MQFCWGLKHIHISFFSLESKGAVEDKEKNLIKNLKIF